MVVSPMVEITSNSLISIKQFDDLGCSDCKAAASPQSVEFNQSISEVKVGLGQFRKIGFDQTELISSPKPVFPNSGNPNRRSVAKDENSSVEIPEAALVTLAVMDVVPPSTLKLSPSVEAQDGFGGIKAQSPGKSAAPLAAASMPLLARLHPVTDFGGGGREAAEFAPNSFGANSSDVDSPAVLPVQPNTPISENDNDARVSNPTEFIDQQRHQLPPPKPSILINGLDEFETIGALPGPVVIDVHSRAMLYPMHIASSFMPLADRPFIVLSSSQSPDGSIELRLDPPELGSVRIELAAESDGIVKAVVYVERIETLDLVRRNIELFRSEAGHHGLKNLDFSFQSESEPQSWNLPKKKHDSPPEIRSGNDLGVTARRSIILSTSSLNLLA